MSGVQESRCCGALGKKTVLVRGNEMVRDTEIGEKGVDMVFEELTDKTGGRWVCSWMGSWMQGRFWGWGQ